MVGAAGIEPATACSQSRRAASALRSELAASPMPTATATMAAFLSGFRTNHRGPSPGNDKWLFPKWKTPRLVVTAGQGRRFLGIVFLDPLVASGAGIIKRLGDARKKLSVRVPVVILNVCRGLSEHPGREGFVLLLSVTEIARGQ